MLAAPDVDTPSACGTARCWSCSTPRACVSELVELRTVNVGNEGVLRITGKGAWRAPRALGQHARDWLERYLAESRPAILQGPEQPRLFVTATRRGHDAADVLDP